jgi:polyhydroxyalkanoate synthesis regulator protein
MGGQTLLPIPFLRQLIRFYGDSIERMVPSYLQVSLETLAKEQERFRKTFADAFTPAGAFEVYQEQARKNLAMFEQAMAMFSPFGKPPGGGARPGAPVEEAKPEPGKPEAAKPAPGATQMPVSAPRSNELDQLKSQLAAMQAKLDELSRKG